MLLVIYSTDEHLHFLLFSTSIKNATMYVPPYTHVFLRYTLRNRIIELLACVFAIHKLPSKMICLIHFHFKNSFNK